jgi:hypothetical protein
MVKQREEKRHFVDVLRNIMQDPARMKENKSSPLMRSLIKLMKETKDQPNEVVPSNELLKKLSIYQKEKGSSVVPVAESNNDDHMKRKLQEQLALKKNESSSGSGSAPTGHTPTAGQ